MSNPMFTCDSQRSQLAQMVSVVGGPGKQAMVRRSSGLCREEDVGQEQLRAQGGNLTSVEITWEKGLVAVLTQTCINLQEVYKECRWLANLAV